jgi:hypothetical protein
VGIGTIEKNCYTRRSDASVNISVLNCFHR